MNVPQEIDLAGSNADVAKWIWQTLVPNQGQAALVQAEVLRAIEKLRWEAQSNSNINWDNRFDMLEEPWLKSTFGEEWNNYSGTVLRWLPRLSPWKKGL